MMKNIFLLSLLATVTFSQPISTTSTHTKCVLMQGTGPLPLNHKPVYSRTLGKYKNFKSRAYSTPRNIFDITYMKAENSQVYSNVNCVSFPESAKQAIKRATEIWSSYIDSPNPIKIRVCWSDKNLWQQLAITQTRSYWSSQPYSNIKPNTYYPLALYNALTGQVTNNFGITILFNGFTNWYFGLDANPGYDKSDFLSTAIHELGHGLGFNGSAKYDNNIGTINNPSDIYDFFIEEGTGEKIINLNNNSIELGNALTSGNLFFNGINSKLANNNKTVKINAPSYWREGSSYGHLDDVKFGSTTNPNRLMTTTLINGDAIHDPGEVTIGILRDLGWKAPRVVNLENITNKSISNCDTFRFTPKTTTSISNLKWSLINPPSGMNINSSNGQIIWYNPTVGTHNITVKATYITNDFDTKTFTLSVQENECKNNALPSVIMYLLN